VAGNLSDYGPETLCQQGQNRPKKRKEKREKKRGKRKGAKEKKRRVAFSQKDKTEKD
jgi:hypothetical protein